MKTSRLLIILVNLIAISSTGYSQQIIDYNKHYDFRGTVTAAEGKPDYARFEFSVLAGSPNPIVNVRNATFGKIKFRSAVWDRVTNEIILYDNDDYIPGGNASFNHVLRLKMFPFSAKGILKVYRFRNANGYGSLYPSVEPNETSEVKLQLSKNTYIPRNLDHN